jgi:hypothetical protein
LSSHLDRPPIEFTMGWFSRKKEIEELRAQLRQLAAAIANQHQAPTFDAGQFINVLMDGQVKQIGSTADFIRMVHDIATERMASAMGRRGGKRRAATAQRDARGRMLPGKAPRGSQADCELCLDPSCSSFTTAQFDAHQLHRRGPRRVEAEPVEPTPEEREVIEIETRPTTQYPLPTVQHPMVPTAEGNQADTTDRDSHESDDHDAGRRNGIA